MSLKALVATGTKVWLDSVEPQEVKKNFALGATGATSNPIIISGIIDKGGFDDKITELGEKPSVTADDIAWELDDQLVRQAQAVFAPVWQRTNGNDGYVSFELDPLLEDETKPVPHAERVKRYIELGKRWSAGHTNRMIKVPATPAGLEALEELCAAGVTLNVTLIFSERQYKLARDAVWRGAQRRKDRSKFKSVYSIFVSRVDVYTEKHVPDLSPAAQGQVGIVNAKRIWKLNHDFWTDKNLPLQQEMIFASTGTKKPSDPPDKYVSALAGSDIQTNPPATNDAVEKMTKPFTRQVDKLPADAVLKEIDQKVDQQKMENKLMEEGLVKFSEPQHSLIKLINEKRAALTGAK